jgi:hypothetical protein
VADEEARYRKATEGICRKVNFLIETRLLPSSLAASLDRSHCPRPHARSSRLAFPSCFAVYPRDFRSRRVLCRASHALH